VRAVERGEGDDSLDIESDFEDWSQKFFTTLDKIVSCCAAITVPLHLQKK